ncbi:MAG: polyprenyl synthetase family protein [Pseudohongiellaceae bacterium]
MYEKIRAAVGGEFGDVDAFITEQLQSRVPLVENIGHYIVAAGGKRLRPVLVLLVAHACGSDNRRHIPLAAVIEFIHTATLLHDDVVDMSDLRRGRPTVNAEWDNPSSVLVGDFIYSRAFQVLVEIGDMRVMRIMADTTNRIAEGEVLQLVHKHEANPTESKYMQIIESKTAILFQAAAQCAAILAGADKETEDNLTCYGRHLGNAFQLIDDVLDYAGDTVELGKNIGDDLAEGKPTLPLIYALQNGDEAGVKLIRDSLTAKTVDAAMLRDVIAVVADSGALDYTRSVAEAQVVKARAAVAKLSPSEHLNLLLGLLDFSLARTV